MNKKGLTSLLILVILALAGLMTFILIPGNARLSRFEVSGEAIEKIAQGRQENPALPLNIEFSGQLLLPDIYNNALFYSVNDGDERGLNPSVKLSDGYKLKVCGQPNAEQIKQGIPLKAVIYTKDEYRYFDLFFTYVPLISIEYTGNLEDGPQDMNFCLYDNREAVSSRVITSEGTVKWRGASTLFYPKKSLKLSLSQTVDGKKKKNHTSLLGMREDEDWILYAAYNDQEKIRDVFSERLWWDGCASDNSWGVQAGMQYKYVEVFINGEYSGLYALGFPVDEKQLGLSGNYEEAALYKKKSWDSEEQLEMTVFGAQPGYDCKTDNPSDLAGLKGEFGVYTDEKGKEVIDMREWQLLYKYYFNLANNADDSAALMESIDVDNAIDLFIFFNLIQGVDNTKNELIKNEYIAVKDTPEGIRSLTVPWDMDITWGNKWVENGDINFTLPYSFEAKENFVPESGYLEQIMVNRDTEIWKLVAEKYSSLRAGAWSDEAIDSILDEYEQDIFESGAYVREMIRWPEGTYMDGIKGNSTQDGIAGENGAGNIDAESMSINSEVLNLDTFRQYVFKRLTYTDAYYGRCTGFGEMGTLLRRTQAYEGFDRAWYLLEFNDHSNLYEDEYVEVLNRMQADLGMVKDNIIFAVGSQEADFSYSENTPDDSGEFPTAIGNITLRKPEDGDYFYEDSYALFLENIRGYDLRLSDRTENVIAFMYDSKIYKLNMKREYAPTVNPESFKDESLKKLAEEFLSAD